MRKGRLNIQLQKLEKFNLVEEANKLAKLHQEIEIAEQKSREMASDLDDKRKRDSLNFGDCKKIETEHLKEIEEMENKKISLMLDLEKKQEEYKNLNGSISALSEMKSSLEVKLPKIKDELDELEINKEIKLKEVNETRIRYEEVLKGLAEEIKKQQDILIDTVKNLDVASKEYKETLERLNEENRLMSIRRKDLEIYELRIRKQNPNIII